MGQVGHQFLLNPVKNKKNPKKPLSVKTEKYSKSSYRKSLSLSPAQIIWMPISQESLTILFLSVINHKGKDQKQIISIVPCAFKCG